MPLQIQKGWCNLKRIDSSRVYCISSREFWNSEVEESDLYSRAWDYQERFLSKTNLHFGHSQLCWECRQQHASEAFSKGFPKRINLPNLKAKLLKALNSDRDDQSNECIATRETWMEIVGSYTNGDLTYKTDKLVAVGGLAAVVSQSIGGRYLEGIWENHLPSGLCWETPDEFTPSAFSISLTGLQNFIAPSWLWASLNSWVTIFGTGSPYSEKIEETCQILESHVDLASDNQFGQVCGGYIKIQGALACAKYKYHNLSILIGSDDALSPPLADEFTFRDYKDITELKRIDYLYLLPICRNHFNDRRIKVDGLTLYLTGQKDWEFRRCGAYVMFEASFHEALESGCKVFSESFEGKESSGNGLDDSGKFTITILKSYKAIFAISNHLV